MRSPLDVAGLIDWLEKQPPGEPYDWYDVQTCVIGQYLQAQGFKAYPGPALGFHHPTGPLDLARAYRAFGHDRGAAVAIGYPFPRTMGAALQRALTYQAKEKEHART